MNELKVFHNSEFGELGVLTIDGKEYFPATQCAKILGHENPSRAVRKYCKGVTEVVTPTNGGNQSTKFIPEGDLYRLIIRSNLPAAEKFERWVFDEVLPELKRSGSYGNNVNLEEIISKTATAVVSEVMKQMVAVAQLDALSEKAQITNSDLDLMSNYADYLNDTFNCNIEVDYDTKSLTGFDPTDINSQMEKIVRDKRKQSASDYITGDEFTNEYIDTYRNYQEAAQKLSELETEIKKAASDPGYVNTTGWKYEDYEKLTNKIAGYENTLKGCNNEIMQSYSQMGYGAEEAENYIDILKGISSASDDAKDSAEDLVEAMTKQEILAEVGDRYKEQIEELCTAYDEAYNAAYESFQGQFGLFEEASMESETYLNSTVANAQAALESQLAYWTEYGNNIDVLKNTSAADLGITQENYAVLMSYVQSGSEEAAGLAQSMVDNINSGSTEAISALANTLSEVDSKQSEVAGKVVDWEKDFSNQMKDMLTNMQGTVDDIVIGMDFSDGADTAAKTSLAVYANQIKSSGESAVNSARAIAQQVSAALSSANTTINVGMNASGSLGIAGHATGTTNAEDIFIAGEEGPELIVGKKGSTVFPADETNRIISAVNESYSSDIPIDNANEASIYSGAETQGVIHAPADKPLYVPPVDSPILRQIEKVSETTSRKEISININGSGSVQVTGGMNKDDILEVMWEYFKPVLAGIIEQESFEEGEGSYEY